MQLIQTVKILKRPIFKFNTQRTININESVTNIALIFY